MRKKYILLSMALLAITIQTGCNQKTEQIAEAETNQILESPSPISNNEHTEAISTNEIDNNIDETFKEKWVNATRFIQQVLKTVPGANEKILKEETDAQFDKLVSDIENGLQDETQVYYRLRSIIASMQHVHMGLDYLNREKYPAGKYANLDTVWTQEGLILFSADEAYKDSVGLVLTN